MLTRRILAAAAMSLWTIVASAASPPGGPTPSGDNVPATAPADASAQPATSGNPPAVARPGSPAASAVPPGAQQAAAAPRRPRSYDVCYRIAATRKYRGAERRHYVRRCQLGYGRPLFRRRGNSGQPG